jgi:hypothetical protein
MSTKNTVTLLLAVFTLMSLSMWLREKTGAVVFIGLALLLSFVSFGLMLYALTREKNAGDKSETVPPKVAVIMLAAVGLWVAFLCFRTLAH